MSDLDPRQLEILEKMGIDVWRYRRSDQIQDPIAKQVPNEENDVAAIDDGPDEVIETDVVSKDLEVKSVDVNLEPESLENIALKISGCQNCELHTTRNNTVPGVGNPNADWIFVGEAPGQNEDEQGLPFVGRAGQLLDSMIAALRMQRTDVFIANVIKCRPPGNRDPLREEVNQCELYLHQQLSLIKPKVIVALGRISAQALLKTTESLGQLRGKRHKYGADEIPLVITYHPAYLLRSPQQKSKSWEDLLLAKSIVEG